MNYHETDSNLIKFLKNDAIKAGVLLSDLKLYTSNLVKKLDIV